MALSGSFTTNKYDGDIGLKLSWTGTQNIADNTTTIKWTLTSNGGSASTWWWAGPVTVVIGSKTVLNTTSRFKLYGGGAYKKTGTLTVSHRADGTQSAWMSMRAAIYSTSVNCTGSHTYTLDTINRYALVLSADVFTDEVGVNGYPKMVYTNPAGTGLVNDLYARIKWTDTSNVVQSTAWTKIDDEGGEYQFTSSSLTSQDIDNMLAACPNSNQLNVQFEVKSTMDETEYTHEKSSVMNVVNANPVPAVGAVTFKDIDDDIVDITGDDQVIVQRQSTLEIKTALSQPQKHATIVSYSLNINGNDYVLDTESGYAHVFEKPDVNGVFPATVTTVDSRGNSATSVTNVTVVEWSEPTCEFTLERVNGFETETILNVDARISSVENINTLTITERHRLINGTWSSASPVQNNTPTSIMLNFQNDWEVEIVVADEFAQTVYGAVVNRGIPIAFIDTKRHSFGINGFPDDDEQLYVGGKIKVKQNETDTGVKLPHVYSETEQIVGYWLDGSPIYEKTIEFQSAVTVNANSWSNNVYTNDENIIVLNGEAYYYDSNSSVYVYWGFMAIQSNTTDKTKINLYNSRDSSCQVSILVIRYIKPTQNNS